MVILVFKASLHFSSSQKWNSEYKQEAYFGALY